MIDPIESGLSDAGRTRREEMLGVLHAAMAGRVRRRRIARGMAVVAVAGAGVWGALQLRPARTPVPAPAPVAITGTDAPLQLRHAVLRIVGPQEHPPASITVVDDDTMLRALREIGRPTGIIRTGGRVTLTRSFWPATDEPDEGDSTG